MQNGWVGFFPRVLKYITVRAWKGGLRRARERHLVLPEAAKCQPSSGTVMISRECPINSFTQQTVREWKMEN